jgi:glycosyltransferase involved in cell wall biosynthesis
VNLDLGKSSYLFTIPWFPSSPIGGVNQAIFNLIHHMRLDGRYRPLLAVLNGVDNPRQPDYVECPVISIRLRDPADPASPIRAPFAFLFWLPWTLYRLRALVVQHQIRAIVNEFPSAEALNFIILKRLGLYSGRVILSLHGNDIKAALEQKGVRRLLHKLTVRLADCVIACSHGLRSDLLCLEPRCKRNSIVIHNAIDIDTNSERPSSGSSLPAALEGRRFLLNIGKFEHKKGQDVLIRAFEKIAGEFPEFQLVMVGATGPRNSEIRQAISASPFSDRILMQENVPHAEIASYLKAASIFILPSRREGFPFTILEAAASKTPIIATDIPGLGEVITEGVTGRLVPVDNAAALAEAIADLLRNEEKRRVFASRLFDVVSTKFTWNSTYQQYIAV